MTTHSYRAWIVFFTAAALFVLSQFYRAAVAVITPWLTSDLKLDARGLSLLSAAFFYAFAFTQVPIAVFLDRIGPWRIMGALNLVAVCGALVFSAAGRLETLIIGRLLLGVGMACNLMGTLKLLSTWFPPLHFATLTAVVFSLGTAGNIVAATPLVLLTGSLGWRGAFVLVAAVNLVLAVLFVAIARDRPPGEGTSAGGRATGPKTAMFAGLRHLLVMPDYWIISFGTFCRYGIYAAVQSLYAGPFLMNVRGFSPIAAGNIILLMNLGFILGGPLFGAVSDRLVASRKKVVIAGLFGLTLVFGALAYLPSDVEAIWPAVLFFMLGVINSTGGLMYSHIKERLPAEHAGTAMTGINFFTMVGPAVFLQGLGSLMQSAYPAAALGADAFRTAFQVSGGCLALVALLYLLTADTAAGRRN
jgi:MFS family permease